MSEVVIQQPECPNPHQAGLLPGHTRHDCDQCSQGRRRSGSKADLEYLRSKWDQGVRYLAIELEAVTSFGGSPEVANAALYESLSSRLYTSDMIQELKAGVKSFCFDCLEVYRGSRIGKLTHTAMSAHSRCRQYSP